jgi:hypothetical protein
MKSLASSASQFQRNIEGVRQIFLNLLKLVEKQQPLEETTITHISSHQRPTPKEATCSTCGKTRSWPCIILLQSYFNINHD